MKNMFRRYWLWFCGLGSVLVIFLTFTPCLANDFTNWDDQEMVTGNPHITDLSPNGIFRIFIHPHSGPYVPLTILSYAVEYHFFRMNPFVFHLSNVLLHAANVILVLILIYALTGNLTAAVTVALLFGVHPQRVESVAWVTERKDVLSGLFFLAGLLAFLRFRSSRLGPGWWLIPLIYVLAILAKPMAFSLPLVLLLVDYFLGGRVNRRTWLLVLIMVILSLPVSAMNIRTQIMGTDTPAFHPLRNFLLGSRNLVWYAAKVLLPIGLSPFYPYPPNFARALPWSFYLAPLLLAAAALLIIWSRRRTRVLVFGSLCYFFTILPVSQFFPIAGPAMAADRYTYLPSIGILFGIGAIITWLEKYPRPRSYRYAITLLVVIIIFVLAAQSRRLCRVWQNSLTLWNEVLRRLPDNALALNNRGRAYSRLGHYTLAIRDYDRAIMVDPRYELPYYNRAVAYDKLHDHERALVDFERALTIKPDLAIAYESRAVTYNRLGRYQEAIADLNRAIHLDPAMDVAYLDRGSVYFKLGLYDRALADYNRALEFDPNYPETYLNRGDVHFALSDYARAIADYTRALTLNPYYYTAYYNRALAYKAIGEFESALADYHQALAIKPDFAEALNNRGNLYLQTGDYQNAQRDYDRAITIRPEYAEAFYNRALSWHLMGNDQRALEDLTHAESLGFLIDSTFKKTLLR